MNTINPTLHDIANLTLSTSPDKSALCHTFKLGLDVDLDTVIVAIQCDNSAIPHAQKFTRQGLTAWIKDTVTQGHTVHTVYESCGFGYTLHEELLAAGARSLVTIPMRLVAQEQIPCGLGRR
ncbi:MAG TPA: hypothetical protein PLK78_16840 [Verrucomicrobiota bacterium]|nr:hypothetical protein [Verrucomicrobiota bacterium]